MCVAILCFPGYDVNSFESNLNLSNQAVFLRTKRGFEENSKAFFIIFKGLSVVKNRLRPESGPLNSFSFKELV